MGSDLRAMDKPTPELPNGPNEGRLDSWKKIAFYLKRDITTVQRWEKREEMPVHRHLHDKMGSVYAFQSELDAWMHGRSAQQPLSAAEPNPEESAASPPKAGATFRSSWRAVALAGALGTVAIGSIIGFERSDHFWRNPFAGAVFQSVTGFDGRNEAAAVSRDGQFIAFLSDRGGRTDVWVTQVGSGRFHNLTGFAPRAGPNYLLYVASAGIGESIWKISGTAAMQLWAGSDARMIGAPAVSADGRFIAFSVRQRGRTLLYAMGSDGSGAHVVSDSLELRGAPAWAPDGRSILTAAEDRGVPHLFRIPLDENTPTQFIGAYSVDPVWSQDGQLVFYSGPDIGTKFAIKAATAASADHSLPELLLTRGARHLALLPGGRKLVFLQGEIQHKNLWLVDLETGAMQQLTHMPAEFDVRDFDLSADGAEAIVERAQARSDVVLLDRPSA